MSEITKEDFLALLCKGFNDLRIPAALLQPLVPAGRYWFFVPEVNLISRSDTYSFRDFCLGQRDYVGIIRLGGGSLKNTRLVYPFGARGYKKSPQYGIEG